MPVLYLTEPGAHLSLRDGRLRVEKGGEVLLSVPVARVQGVLIWSGADVSSAALLHLLAQGAPISFLSRAGRLRGRVVPPLARNAPLRLRQFVRHSDMEFRVTVSRAILHGKISNGRTLLLRGSRRNLCPDTLSHLQNASKTLSHRLTELARRTSIAPLMGVEGAAAAVYFRAFNELLPAEFHFDARSRRPPRDAANALLSLGYNLVGAEIDLLP